MKKLSVLGLLLLLSSLLFAGGGTQAQTGKISPSDAQTLLKSDPSVILLDVRTPEEFAQGYIKGAKLLPYDKINAASAAAAIPRHDSMVLLYCRSGNRSGIAIKTLQGLGYTKLLNLGGIINWPYEIVRDSQR